MYITSLSEHLANYRKTHTLSDTTLRFLERIEYILKKHQSKVIIPEIESL